MIEIRKGYQTGLIADVTGLHAHFYSQNYGFGVQFERQVASGLSEFMGRIEQPVNQVFSACDTEGFLGSVSIDGEDLGSGIAHLRWFIIGDRARGQKLGGRLIGEALAFVDQSGFEETRLWTFKGLDAARHLYEQHGFELANEAPGSQWGTEVLEQEFIRKRTGPS